jgi:hypothetical protein
MKKKTGKLPLKKKTIQKLDLTSSKSLEGGTVSGTWLLPASLTNFYCGTCMTFVPKNSRIPGLPGILLFTGFGDFLFCHLQLSPV